MSDPPDPPDPPDPTNLPDPSDVHARTACPAGDASDATVLALIRDLMFSSRVTATARQLGLAVKLIRDPAKLAGEPGARLIVDLNLDGAIEAAANWRQATGRHAVGFVSHVDAATIQRARAAGIDRVMLRSQFVQLLPELLRTEG